MRCADARRMYGNEGDGEKGLGNARGCPFVPDVNPISTADVKCRTDFGFVCVNSAGAARTREKQKADTAADPRCPVTRWRRNGLRSRGVAIRVYTDERVNFAARSRTSGPGCRITLPALYLMPQRESAVPYSPSPSLSLSRPTSFLSHLVSSGCSPWKPRSRRRRPNTR